MAKKRLIVGLGVTGRALLDYFSRLGQACIGLEEGAEQNFLDVQQKYGGKGMEFYFQTLPDELLNEVEEIFVSPGVDLRGVALTKSWLRETNQIPVRGELELAFQQLRASKIIGVTGTNGKSTTVSLIQKMLELGGKSSSLKGNIGDPLLTAVSSILAGQAPKDYYVVEISSYQLETIETFCPDIAVLLNVTEDHLDRYDSFADYAEAKGRLLMNQTASSAVIYNADDVHCRRLVAHAVAEKIPFSLTPPPINTQHAPGLQGYVDQKNLIILDEGKTHYYPLAEMALQGMHQQENMLATLLVAHRLGLDDGAIRAALSTFKPLKHRMSFVGIFHGMKFYDDSKATNVGATVMSLASFQEKIILLMGGRDKGGDYAPLKGLVSGKIKALILLGEAKEKINQALHGLCPTFVVENMEEAVAQAYAVGSAGDVVLLAPACSSFDQYKNYAERGEDFVRWVQAYAPA